MSYNTSTTQVSNADRAIAGVFAAGIMFIAGYTAVRMGLSQATPQDPSVINPVVPHEGTLWVDFSN